MKYKIYISQMHYGSVIVDADTAEHATELGYAAIEKGEVYWHETEVTDVQPEQEPDNFPCCLYPTDRSLDWCEEQCANYYSCDTVAAAIDEDKIREDK